MESSSDRADDDTGTLGGITVHLAAWDRPTLASCSFAFSPTPMTGPRHKDRVTIQDRTVRATGQQRPAGRERWFIHPLGLVQDDSEKAAWDSPEACSSVCKSVHVKASVIIREV